MANGNTILTIDYSNLEKLIASARDQLNEKQFYQAMYRALRRAGMRARTLVKNEVRVDYAAPAGYVLGSISAPRLSSGGGGVSCVLNVANSRGRVGPIYKARGRRSRKGIMGRMAAFAKIVTAGESQLPETGERPHFMTPKGVYVRMVGSGTYIATMTVKNKNGTVRTYRVRKEKIRPAVGIAVPQMPLNRSEARIQTNVEKLIGERVLHECQVLIDGIV